MLVRRGVTPHLGIALTAVLLGSALLGMVRSVHAQAGTQGTLYPEGVPADIGDGWTISVESAALNVSSSNDGSPAGPPLLVATLQVRNTAAEPRGFPTYRLHVTSGSGTPQRDTWCGRDKNPLELSGQISPNGTQRGTACWAMSSADTSNVVLSVDPPPSEGGRQPGSFSLAPAVSVMAPAVPTATVASPALVESPVADQAGQSTPRSRCLTTYSMNAGGAGTYVATGCATTNTASTTLPNGTIPAATLVPTPIPGSSYQATSNGSGTTLLAPGVPSRPAILASGVPACQLYPSARQPSSSTFPNGSSSITAATTAIPTPIPGSVYQAPSNGGSC
jgi:hypothetical protein